MPTYVTIPYVDRKGEKGNMKVRLESPTSFAPTTFTADILSLSQVGASSYVIATETDFATPQAAGVGTDMSNDKDVKAVLLFDWPDVDAHIRLSIPAPKINVEAGIVIRWGNKEAFVPPTKEVGEIGHDGNQIATSLATAVGATGGLTFLSGALLKRP